MTSVPTIVFDDTTRVRAADPIPSHEAADSTAATRKAVMRAVEMLIWESAWQGLTDDELNDLYAINADSYGWPFVDYGTPRRRRSDLTKDGRIVAAIQRRPNSNGRKVTVWVLQRYAGMLK